MAIQTGNIKYRGSFKSIRQYVNLHDPHSYAGEKGGANRDLIMNNPAFARTRENMNEFSGCGAAVKAIRRGLLNLLPEQTDTHFTGRLMSMVKEINVRDVDGIRGQRSIMFSSSRPLIMRLVLNKLENIAEVVQNYFVSTHPITRADATLSLTDLIIKPVYVPKGATHFRVQNHLSIIADYAYIEATHSYEPASLLNSKSAFEYSEYTPVGTALTAEVKAAYPVDTEVPEDCTVIQCVGIEFYAKSGVDGYLPLKGSSMKVIDVF